MTLKCWKRAYVWGAALLHPCFYSVGKEARQGRAEAAAASRRLCEGKERVRARACPAKPGLRPTGAHRGKKGKGRHTFALCIFSCSPRERTDGARAPRLPSCFWLFSYLYTFLSYAVIYASRTPHSYAVFMGSSSPLSPAPVPAVTRQRPKASPLSPVCVPAVTPIYFSLETRGLTNIYFSLECLRR